MESGQHYFLQLHLLMKEIKSGNFEALLIDAKLPQNAQSTCKHCLRA